MASEPMRRLIARLEDEKAAADPDASWQRMREDYAALAQEFPADPAATARADRLAGVEAVRFQGAAADQSRAVVYLHGGGYTIGGIASHEALTSRLALAAGCPLFALDYRLAPEHPFPAAVDDAAAACRALVARGIAPGGWPWPAIRPAAAWRWPPCSPCAMAAMPCPPAPRCSRPGPTWSAKPAGRRPTSPSIPW